MAQLTFTQVEPAMKMVQLAEEMLKDYRWMPDEIKRVRADLEKDVDGFNGASDDDNAGIRAQYKNSDKVGNLVAKRERRWNRLQEMERKVMMFEHAVGTITDVKHATMLDYLLDGTAITHVAGKMKKSRTWAHREKDKLVRKLAWAMYEKDPDRDPANEAAAVA